jgi:hypothetical protein
MSRRCPWTDADPLAATWNQPPQPGDVACSACLACPQTRAPSPPGAFATAGGTGLRRIAAARTAVECDDAPDVRHRFAAFQVAPIRVTANPLPFYRAGDGDWYLGRRTMGPAGWDVAQPVAGPLSSAGDRGLRIVVRDGAATRSGASAVCRRASACWCVRRVAPVARRRRRRTDSHRNPVAPNRSRDREPPPRLRPPPDSA